MKTTLATLMGAVMLFTSLAVAQTKIKVPHEKFYGKISHVDHDTKLVTVKNKKKKLEADFSFDEEMFVILKKKRVAQNLLEQGQNVIVYYTEDDDKKVASRITIRASKPKDLTAKD